MIKIKDITNIDLPQDVTKKYGAIGVFDGVHLGHQSIIKSLVRSAKKSGALSIVVTFANHPLEVLAPPYAPKFIMTLERRVELLKSLEGNQKQRSRSADEVLSHLNKMIWSPDPR